MGTEECQKRKKKKKKETFAFTIFGILKEASRVRFPKPISVSHSGIIAMKCLRPTAEDYCQRRDRPRDGSTWLKDESGNLGKWGTGRTPHLRGPNHDAHDRNTQEQLTTGKCLIYWCIMRQFCSRYTTKSQRHFCGVSPVPALDLTLSISLCVCVCSRHNSKFQK